VLFSANGKEATQMTATLGRVVGASFVIATLVGTNAVAGDPLSGRSLYDDVRRYHSFGQHRYGSPGAERAFEWIASELNRAGLAVSSQPFTMARQYDFEEGSLTTDGQANPVVPHWWIPEAFLLLAASGRGQPGSVGPKIPSCTQPITLQWHRVKRRASTVRMMPVGGREKISVARRAHWQTRPRV
jgi:hypothetical protein